MYQFRLHVSSMNSFAPPLLSLPNSYSSCPTEHYPHIDSITALPCCMIHLKAIAISMTFVAFDLCPKTYMCICLLYTSPSPRDS